MSGLVEKLEAAEVGSRELDALIWLRVNRPEYQGGVKALEMRTWYDGRGHLILETDAGEEVADNLGIAPVTTSLDAALALAERVLPEWTSWEIFSRRAKTRFVAEIARMSEGEPDEEIREYGHAPTPAMALCIAILRALNLNETRHD